MIDTINQYKVVPVCSVKSVDDGLRLCEALSEGGLPIAEITFRTSAAELTIKAAAEKFPDMLIGAGTILNTDDLQRAIQAGATFAVAPGTNPEVVKAAVAQNFAFFPGVAVPTDIERAMALGVKILKFFPAEAVGGVKLLKAMCAPYAHTGVKFIPTGGINAENMMDYLALEPVIAVGGSWMVAKNLIEAQDWKTVGRLAKEALLSSHQIQP